jgi:hypothetical protein
MPRPPARATRRPARHGLTQLENCHSRRSGGDANLTGTWRLKYHEIDTMEAAAPPRVRYFACVTQL